jgi:hypothetical protein
VAGLVIGGAGSGLAVLWTLLPTSAGGWVDVLLAQPAAWSVPLTFLTMVGVSRATRERAPAHARAFLIRLHAPETVRVSQE